MESEKFPPKRGDRLAENLNRCSVTSGNGRRVRIWPTRATALQRGMHWANTTENSCAISLSFAGGLLHHVRTSADGLT